MASKIKRLTPTDIYKLQKAFVTCNAYKKVKKRENSQTKNFLCEYMGPKFSTLTLIANDLSSNTVSV